MKNEYINIVFHKIAKNSKNFGYGQGYLLSNLRKHFYGNENSYIFKELFQKISCLITPKDFDKVKERKTLIESPSKDSWWYYLLSNSYYNPEIVKSLSQMIIEVIDDIVANNFTIEETISLSKHSQSNREAFIAYLTIISEQVKSQVTIENAIQSLIERFLTISGKKTRIKLYIEKFIENKASDFEQIKPTLQSFSEDFFKMTVSTFGFPPLLAQFDAISAEISEVMSSEIYTEYYLHKRLNPTTQYPSAVIINLTREAFNEMKAEMNVLFSNIKTFKLIRLVEITENVKYVEKELNILKEFMKASDENMKILKDLLGFVKNQVNIEVFCQSLLDLESTVGFSDKSILDLCANFMASCVAQKNTVSCGDYLETSHKTKEKLTKHHNQDLTILIIELINALKQAPELIKFCFSLKSDELDYLKESVNDYDDAYVSAQDIINFQQVWEYLNEIRGSEAYQNFIETITKQKIDTVKLLISNIKRCTYIITQIKQLHLELNLKEEAKKKQIVDIYKESRIKFVKDSKNFDLEVCYEINKMDNAKTIILKLSQLLELKDRASLITNTADEKDINLEQITGFIELVNVAYDIIETLNKLKNSGYPEIHLPEDFFICREGNFEEVKSYDQVLQTLYET